MKTREYLQLVVSVAVPLAAGAVGSLFTTPAIPGWYASLARPSFAPPNWVFGPVWTTLFLMMGVAAFLVWRRGFTRREVRVALGVFLIQLVLNTLWSVLFFGLRRPDLAFAEVVVLWLAIVATILVFRRVSRVAAWLLVPYLAWVSFASYLNFAYWRLNA